MLRQLQDLTIPAAVSIAFFDATFLAIAQVWQFSGREIALGVAAGAAGGLFVLAAILLQSMRSGSGHTTAAQLPLIPARWL
jgi:hypothetical protein